MKVVFDSMTGNNDGQFFGMVNVLKVDDDVITYLEYVKEEIFFKHHKKLEFCISDSYFKKLFFTTLM